MKNIEEQTLFIKDEAEMLALGAKFSSSIKSGCIIFLYGDLGAGKTTFSRGFLRGKGHEGKVKSPTYTIVEPYEIQGQHLYHFDFYRLHDPEELEFIGIQDYFTTESICLVEWPDHGGNLLPPADVSCYIESHLEGRRMRIKSHSDRGRDILNCFLVK